MRQSAVIVQARMGSARLPGKVLYELDDRTVLEHVLSRCRRIEGIETVCCAIPDTSDCDLLAQEVLRIAGGEDVHLFRGSEEDVLDRYYRAAVEIGADRILRVTSDCPLIDPAVCSRVLALLADEEADYAANNLTEDWPHGLDCEAFSFSWLERAATEATSPFDREHVTPFIRNHSEVRKVNLPGPGSPAAHHRWTLDTEADLAFLRALFERLPAGEAGWSYEVPLRIVSDDPTLASINATDNPRRSTAANRCA